MKIRDLLFVVLAVAGGAHAAGAVAAPEVFVSLRGVLDDKIEVGEPLFVGVRIEAPFESKAPLVLAPARGTWADGIEVIVTRGGVALPLRATATFKPAAASVTLDAERATGGEWFFPAEETRRLAPGEYAVQVRLSISGGAGWSGAIASEATTLVCLPPSPDPARVLQRTVAPANEALAMERLQDGVRAVDVLLGEQPDNLRLLAIRARLSARAGDLVAAMTCLDRAMSTPEVERLRHPPIGLFELRDDIGRALLSPAGRASAPPEWTKLPPSVLERIRPPKPAAMKAGPVESRTPAPTPLSPATPSPRSAPSSAPPAAPPIPAAPATAGPAPGTLVSANELADAKVTADPAGRWAASARAGSSYSNPNYGPGRATGAPNVASAGDSVEAWCPGRQNDGAEWLELAFANPVRAVEVRVRQTNIPGTIAKVEAITADGTVQVWWEGTDTAGLAANGLAWFAVRVPPTAFAVAKIKLTLDLARRSGWKQIDAVQLVAAP